MNRSTVALLLFVALVIGLWLWMAVACAPTPPTREPGNASVEPEAAVGAAQPRHESSPERLIAIPRFRCLDVLGKPVAGVAVWPVPEGGGLAAVPSDDRVSRTDAHGCVEVGRDWLQRTTFCVASGFRVARVRWDVLESRDVVLEPAVALEVFVRAPGRAVADATVVVSAFPVMANADLGMRAKHGAATVLSTEASAPVLWRSAVDAEGRAAFRNLEPGSYHVAVFSDTVVPATEVGLGEIPFAIPCAPVVVEMVPMWAAVAALPRGVERAGHASLIDNQLLAKEGGAVARTRHLTARLKDKFKTDLVRVGMLPAGAVASPPSVEFRVVDTLGRLWSGEVPMMEIATIEAPSLLALDEGVSTGRVRLKVRHPDGGVFAGSIEVVATGSNAKKVPTMSVRDGDVLSLPVGVYSWRLSRINAWATDPRVEQRFCDVLAGAEVEAVVTLPKLVPVTIRPRFEGDALDRGMSVRAGANKASSTWLWYPAEGDIHTLVPEGKVVFRGNAAGMAQVEIERIVSMQGDPVVVDLVMTVPPKPVQKR